LRIRQWERIRAKAGAEIPKDTLNKAFY